MCNCANSRVAGHHAVLGHHAVSGRAVRANPRASTVTTRVVPTSTVTTRVVPTSTVTTSTVTTSTVPNDRVVPNPRMVRNPRIISDRVATTRTVMTRVVMTRVDPPPIEYQADTAVWGAPLWRVLHTVAEYTDTPTSFSLWEHLLNLLTNDIPCMDCRGHFTTYLQSNPIDVTDRGALVVWLFCLHNDVNQRIGKPVLDDPPGLQYGTRASILTDLAPIVQGLSVSFPPAVIEVLQSLVTELSRV
jgi:hypothetical protein